MPCIPRDLGTFTVTINANTMFDLSAPFDVGDWKVLQGQFNTVASTASANADLELTLWTALDKDNYPLWEQVGPTYLCQKDVGASISGGWEAGLRKWAKIRIKNTTASTTLRVTVNVGLLFKERTT